MATLCVGEVVLYVEVIIRMQYLCVFWVLRTLPLNC